MCGIAIIFKFVPGFYQIVYFNYIIRVVFLYSYRLFCSNLFCGTYVVSLLKIVLLISGNWFSLCAFLMFVKMLFSLMYNGGYIVGKLTDDLLVRWLCCEICGVCCLKCKDLSIGAIGLALVLFVLLYVIVSQSVLCTLKLSFNNSMLIRLPTPPPSF